MRQLPPPVWSRMVSRHLQRDQAPIATSTWARMEEAAARAAAAIRVCRRVLPTHTVGAPAIQVVGRRRTRRGDGDDARPVELRIVHQDFSISEPELDPSRLIAAAADAATVCALAEDHLVLNGQPELTTPGLLTAAGRRLPLGRWRTPETVVELVQQAARDLATGYPAAPRALFLSPALYDLLATDAAGLAQVQGQCTAGICVTPVLTRPAAVVLPAVAAAADVAVAQDLTLGYLGRDRGRCHFRALAILALRIKDPDALCALTDAPVAAAPAPAPRGPGGPSR